MPISSPSRIIRAVAFDATGTLIALREAVGETYARFAAAHGVALPAWRLGDAFARVLAHAPPRCFPSSAPEQRIELERQWWLERVRQTIQAADSTVRPTHFDDFDRFREALFDAYRGPDLWQLRPGAREALRSLATAGVRMALVSNFDHRLNEILELLGISPFFEFVALPHRTGLRKPAAQIFEDLCARFDLLPSACAYVGDDPDDVMETIAALGWLTLRAPEDLSDLPETLERTAKLRASHEARQAHES